MEIISATNPVITGTRVGKYRYSLEFDEKCRKLLIFTTPYTYLTMVPVIFQLFRVRSHCHDQGFPRGVAVG